jgi:hypothetical protein
MKLTNLIVDHATLGIGMKIYLDSVKNKSEQVCRITSCGDLINYQLYSLLLYFTKLVSYSHLR